MPDTEDEQWARIAAESELKPDRGIVDDVPPATLTPAPTAESAAEPIELDGVPRRGLEETEPEPEPEAGPPIAIVPFAGQPVVEAGPEIILAAPFDLAEVEADALPETAAQQLITEVPTPHPDIVDSGSDLPEVEKESRRTPWWRLMLGGGESREERRSRTPEAVPGAAPVPREAAEDASGPSEEGPEAGAGAPED